MPMIGYGTYKCTDGSDERIIKMDLGSGYRLFVYLLSQNICVIPKSSSIERMYENLYIPDAKITEEDMYLIKSLPQLGWSGEHPDLRRVAPQEDYKMLVARVN